MPVVATTSEPNHPDRKIGIGELGVISERGILRTLVGSCIGLVLHDSRMRVGGLAHIVLAKSDGSTDQPGKYADTAVTELIRLIALAGGKPDRLIAKFAGGANMFASTKSVSIGELNTATVTRLLKEAGIPVLGRDCGGGQGRRMVYDVETGIVRVEIVGVAPFDL